VSAATPAQIAKGALRRLAMQQLEPTPEHFAKAYAQEAGLTPSATAAQPSESGRVWAALFERLAKGLERGGRHWTGARKKQSLQRVLDGSRADAAKLQQRLGQLITSWDDDSPAGDVEPSGLAPLDETPASAATPAATAL
jgi:diguanylate cyclase